MTLVPEAETVRAPGAPAALRIAALDEASAAIELSVIVPTLNEAANISELVERIDSALAPILPTAYEIIVVDDDSPDLTWQIAERLAAENPRLSVIRRTSERCLSTAVIRGWQAARGRVLAVIDGDLQHPPELLVRLWAEMARGADLAVASRHVRGGGVSEWSVFRRIVSRGAQFLGLILLPGVVSAVSDPMSGFFMVRREAVAGVPFDPLGYKILIEVLGRARFRRTEEVGYVFQERAEGRSKADARIYLQYLIHLCRLWRARFRRSPAANR